MPSSELEELEADFGEVVSLLGEGRRDRPAERPSDAVWAAIAAETGLPPGAIGPRHDAGDGEGGPDPEEWPDATTLGRTGRSDRLAASPGLRAAVAVAGVAAVLLVGVPLALALAGGDDARTAQLTGLGGFDGTGRAELDGHTLSVELDGVELDGVESPDGAFHELWLLDIDLDGGGVQGARSLGPIESGGSFEVPDDIDLELFDVVDVSLEPDDGDPAHSGVSILQGRLAGT